MLCNFVQVFYLFGFQVKKNPSLYFTGHKWVHQAIIKLAVH